MYEDIFKHLNLLEYQLKEAITKFRDDKNCQKLLHNTLKKIPTARRGIKALTEIESILEGVIAWQKQISKSE